jgi:hypothetical protein
MAGRDESGNQGQPNELSGGPPTPQPPEHVRLAQAVRMLGIVLSGSYAACLAMRAAFVGTLVSGAVISWFALLLLVVAVQNWRSPDSMAPFLLLVSSAMAFCVVVCLLLGEIRQVVLMAVLAGLAAFLGVRYSRRVKVPRKRWRPLHPALGSAALAGGLVAGAALGLFLYVDEAPQRFPRLEAVLAPVADAENGFAVLKEAMAASPVSDPREASSLLDEWWHVPVTLAPEWCERARPVLAENRGCLEAVDRVLARPAFRPPLPQTFEEASGVAEGIQWHDYAREIAHLMSVNAALLRAEGRPEPALAEAGRACLFGLKVSAAGRGLSPYLTGVSVLCIGLTDMREAARMPGVTADMLRPETSILAAASELRQALTDGLAGDFCNARVELEHWASPESLRDKEEVSPGAAWLASVRFRRLPWVKVNLTANSIGTRIDKIIYILDHLPPASARGAIGLTYEEPKGPGIVAFFRNPLGWAVEQMSWVYPLQVTGGYLSPLAQLHLTRLFLALRCYELERGGLPEKLDGLAPGYLSEIPLDPYTDAPFVYEPDAQPPCLYSVGSRPRPGQQPSGRADDLFVPLKYPASGSGGQAGQQGL